MTELRDTHKRLISPIDRVPITSSTFEDRERDEISNASRRELLALQKKYEEAKKMNATIKLFDSLLEVTQERLATLGSEVSPARGKTSLKKLKSMTPPKREQKKIIQPIIVPIPAPLAERRDTTIQTDAFHEDQGKVNSLVEQLKKSPTQYSNPNNLSDMSYYDVANTGFISQALISQPDREYFLFTSPTGVGVDSQRKIYRLSNDMKILGYVTMRVDGNILETKGDIKINIFTVPRPIKITKDKS